MDQQVDKTLAIKYFDGLCTPHETVLVIKWLKEERSGQQLQQWLWEEWQELQGAMPQDDVIRLKWKIDKQIFPVQNATARLLKPWHRYSVAAAIIIVLAITGMILFERGAGRKTETSRVIAYTDSIINNNRDPIKAALADGSTVWLNSGAGLYLTSDFNKSERRVKLKGEALFEIKQDPVRPFYTEAGNIITQVLGTSYNIEAYPAEKEVRVSLLSGRVVVRSADTTCMLLPGQMAFCAKRTGAMQVASVAASDPSAWIRGKIVMNKISLPDALDRLTKLYHTPIRYNYNMIKGKYITGEFDRDTLPAVLQSVLFVHSLKFSLTGDGGYQISGNDNKK